MDDQHAGIGAVFRHNVRKVSRAVFGCCPSAKRLLYRIDIVVDSLRETDNGEVVVVLLQECRKIGRCGIGIVAADSVQDINAILHQLVGRDLLRIFAFLDKTALDAILDVGKFDAGIADSAATELKKIKCTGTNLTVDLYRFALQQTLITVEIANDLDFRVGLCVFVNEAANSGTQARGKASGRKYRHLLDLLFRGCLCICFGGGLLDRCRLWSFCHVRLVLLLWLVKKETSILPKIVKIYIISLLCL